MREVNVIPPKLYRRVEYYLYNLETVERQCAETRADITEQANYGHEQTRVSKSDISDPTAMTAMRLLASVDADEAWCKHIRVCMDDLRPTKLWPLIESKYIRDERSTRTCQTINIGQTTYWQWRDETVAYIAVRALERGLPV